VRRRTAEVITAGPTRAAASGENGDGRSGGLDTVTGCSFPRIGCRDLNRHRNSETTASFDRLLDQALERGPAHPVDYRLDAPKWQFLCYAADRTDVVLHGSGDPVIQLFEPRQPADTLEFSNRRAVFAATDGIWPMYFAILDRERHPTMMRCNSCTRISSTDGPLSEPYYFFSISRPALKQQPWRAGTVYILPAHSFEAQPPIYGRRCVAIRRPGGLSTAGETRRRNLGVPQRFPIPPPDSRPRQRSSQRAHRRRPRRLPVVRGALI
jgi:hypothetical protein